ncbi:nucleotidyltransferase family protein, partial [Pseudonocardia zijingensis]
MGRPKALVALDGEPLVRRAVRVLADGGCGPLVVVVGAAAEEVEALLPAGVRAVVADGWAEGMGASLRAGLAALEALEPVPDAALVHLVDLPG